MSSVGNPIIYGGVGSPQSVYETSTVQYHRTGQRGHLADRVFCYAKVTGTSIAPNVLAQSPVVVANHTSQTGALVGFTAGSRQFTAVLGATAADANQYEDGYIKIQSSTLGSGQIYKLQSHGAVGSAGTGTFLTYDPIVTTTTGTTTWSLIRSPWAEPIITPVTTQTNMNCGVPLVATGTGTATAPVFVWLQTWGMCSVLGDTTDLAAGTGVLGQGATAGTVALEAAASITQRPGICFATLATDNVFQSIFLRIAP